MKTAATPFETHAFGVGVTYGIVDDVDVSVRLGHPAVFDSTNNYDVGDSISGPAGGFVSLIEVSYRIVGGLQCAVYEHHRGTVCWRGRRLKWASNL